MMMMNDNPLLISLSFSFPLLLGPSLVVILPWMICLILTFFGGLKPIAWKEGKIVVRFVASFATCLVFPFQLLLISCIAFFFSDIGGSLQVSIFRSSYPSYLIYHLLLSEESIDSLKCSYPLSYIHIYFFFP